MKLTFSKKFSELQFDELINEIVQNKSLNNNDVYHFDLTQTEWISNQGLLLFTALLKYFIENNIEFEIEFIKKGTSTSNVSKRVALQIVQIWEVWGMFRIIPNYEYKKYLGLDLGTINSLKENFNINLSRKEIFDSIGITPFICLDYITEYDDSIIKSILNDYHKLNTATTQIVNEKKCSHPFVNNLFGEIISKEIYENFLDHSESNFFKTNRQFAFFSLALKGEISEVQNSELFVQRRLKENFISEELPESKKFFYDNKLEQYRNRSYISYSFLDFGKGIPETLKDEYLKYNKQYISDSEVIKFGFRHDTSRHKISEIDEIKDISHFIPRGLFDVLSIVRRYSGLIIVRSGYGKVLYDFSETQSIEEGYSTFGNNELYFPGTFITIYLPSISNLKEIDNSAIKPTIITPEYSSKTSRYLSLYEVFNESSKKSKKDTYNFFFNQIKNHLKTEITSITFLDFNLIDNERLIKKMIFYLISSYDINLNNNIIIINPPQKRILEEVNYEIRNLSTVTIDYKIHPLPFIYNHQEDIEVYWMGVFDESDVKNLDNLLFEDYTLTKSDFNFPENITGHLNSFDDYNNLVSSFPNRDIIKLVIEFGELAFKIVDSQSIIEKSNYLLQEEGWVYFCNSSNYYQKEFIELTHLLNNNKDCDIISASLFSLINSKIDSANINISDIHYITITTNSNKIAESLISQELIKEEQVISLDTFREYQLREVIKDKLTINNYVLLCDVLATGNTVVKIEAILNAYNFNLLLTAVIFEAIDINYTPSKIFYEKYSDTLLSVYKYPINKYLVNSKEVSAQIENQKVIRINPYTNIPISLSIDDADNEQIILNDSEFISALKDEHIKIGFLKKNNIIHPYYFDTENIIKDGWELIFSKVFSKKEFGLPTEGLKLFYPKNSDIKHLDFEMFKNHILKNHNVDYYALERFISEDGWIFPHTSNFLSGIVRENSILILDDGSCTGDSLTQMMNEISYYKPISITIISLIGRVLEHKREFLSSIREINKCGHTVSINIFFVSHWHIPTYHLEENPMLEERNWLKEIERIYNTPQKIKNIASTILKELHPSNNKNNCDYRFFPRIKESGAIPNKEIIRVRNEIGKVLGYRIYKENFRYFDYYLSLFQKPDTDKASRKERVKETELLCSIIAYEPYLFTKLDRIVPDVIVKIKGFIDTIFFGNPSKGFQKIDISKLTYTWNKRDFLHIYFIIFNEDELIQKLKNEYLITLINFLGNDGESIYYILYKLLKYFPLTKDELLIKDGTVIKRIIDAIIKRGNISSKALREIKIFRSFISTLPFNGNYYSQLTEISENYRKNKDAQNHKNSATSNLDTMLVGIDILRQNIAESTMSSFYDSWEVVSEFIEPILSFSKSFPSFFIDNLFILENDKRTALRTVHGRLNKLIPNLSNQSDFNEIEESLLIVQNKLLSSKTELYHILSNVQTINLPLVIKEYFEEYLGSEKISQLIEQIPVGIIIDFPEYYLRHIVFEEIIGNLRYAKIDTDSKLDFNVNIDNSYVIINIKNKILVKNSNGGGNGLHIFDRANLFPQNIFKYSSKSDDNYFHQTIKLKRTKI